MLMVQGDGNTALISPGAQIVINNSFNGNLRCKEIT